MSQIFTVPHPNAKPSTFSNETSSTGIPLDTSLLPQEQAFVFLALEGMAISTTGEELAEQWLGRDPQFWASIIAWGTTGGQTMSGSCVACPATSMVVNSSQGIVPLYVASDMCEASEIVRLGIDGDLSTAEESRKSTRNTFIQNLRERTGASSEEGTRWNTAHSRGWSTKILEYCEKIALGVIKLDGCLQAMHPFLPLASRSNSDISKKFCTDGAQCTAASMVMGTSS